MCPSRRCGSRPRPPRVREGGSGGALGGQRERRAVSPTRCLLAPHSASGVVCGAPRAASRPDAGGQSRLQRTRARAVPAELSVRWQSRAGRRRKECCVSFSPALAGGRAGLAGRGGVLAPGACHPSHPGRCGPCSSASCPGAARSRSFCAERVPSPEQGLDFF